MAAGLLQRPCHKQSNINPTFLVLLLQLFAVIPIVAVHVSYEQFEGIQDPDNALVPLQRMVLDESTGSIYVGSKNRLYKLSSNLQIELENITGPVEDNQKCPPPPRNCSIDLVKESTDNFNKVLVVNADSNQLITCGSVYQGICQVQRLNDLSLVEEPLREVVTNTEEGTNVAFIAPGPSGSGNLLYTAASDAPWLRDVPTVSKRVLDRSTGQSTFYPIAEKRIPQNTFDETAPDNIFDINYMYGFSSGQFSYFIATQLEDFRVNHSPLYTKIVRLCQEENIEEIYSYIELPLVCKDSNNVNYNQAKSAYVSKVGTALYEAGVPQDDDVLFVTFSQDSSGGKSIVCMYPIRTINDGFLARVSDCATEGTDTTEIDWLGSSVCTEITNCGKTLNTSIFP